MSRMRLNVEINSKMYMLSCEPEERERLTRVAAAVDAKVRATAEANGVSGQGAFVLALLSSEEDALQLAEENDVLAGRTAELLNENERLQHELDRSESALHTETTRITAELTAEIARLKTESAQTYEKTVAQLTEENTRIKAELTAENARLQTELTAENERIKHDLTEQKEHLRTELTAENARLQAELAAENERIKHDLTEQKERIKTQLNDEKKLLRDEMADDLRRVREELTADNTRLKSELERARKESGAQIALLETEASELRYTLKRRNEGAPDPETEALQATLRRIGDRLSELSKRVQPLDAVPPSL